MKKIFIFLTTFLMLMFLNFNMVFATDGTSMEPSTIATKLGILTILPPLIAIILAFITKNVVVSLFIGLFTGVFLLQCTGDFNFFSAIVNSFSGILSAILGALADPWNAGIILQCLFISGLIAVISRIGGTKAIAEALAKKANSPRSSQLITWLLGLFIFFDDYANSLIVGPIMKPVSDKMRVSREKLSFIIDATAAPIAGIALISTWVGLEVSLIRDGFIELGIEANAYTTFIQTIPYRFYNILILIFVVVGVLLLREFGPMLTAERRARSTGEVLRKGSNPLASDNKDLEAKDGVKLNIWNAILPIGLLIISAFVGFYVNGKGIILADTDIEAIRLITESPFSFGSIQCAFGASDASVVLFGSALLSSILAIIMACTQKILSLTEAIDTWVNGMKSLMITVIILLLAWSLSSTIKELGTSHYLVAILSDSIPAFTLPSIIFILAAIISFATGTSYGTMGILMPLAIPLGHAMGGGDFNFMILTISAVLTGAVFGDHCSPISDTTILSSMGTGCDHIDHVKTQIFYALPVGAISIIFGYIPAALGTPIYLVLPIAIIAVILLVRFLGKPIEENVVVIK
ncbi:MAG: Na+/H+ antiporter NhaC family protein [Clostridium sp.]